MKRKYLDGRHWDALGDYACEITHIDGRYVGYVSVIEVKKAARKITVDYEDTAVCLLDDGFSQVTFLPDGDHWCASAVYDRSGALVEWYFDITTGSRINADGCPYYDDLYLDVAVAPDGRAVLLDEDELAQALQSGEITKDDFARAYAVSERIIRKILPDKAFMDSFFDRFLKTPAPGEDALSATGLTF